MSIQFPTIFTMSLRGLGTYTKSGSSFLVMAIVGGALIPLVMGGVSDASTINVAMFVPAACFRRRAVVCDEVAPRSRRRRMTSRMSVALASRELGTHRARRSARSDSAARRIGNLYRELRDEDAGAAVRESFAAGVRYFDTAPFYGFGLERAAARQGAARRAAAARDLHEGRPPARAHRPAGCERRARGIFLAAAVRAGVRLRLRLGHAFARREPRAARRRARRHPAVPRHRPPDAWRRRMPRACANSSTAAIARCASCAMPARFAPSASASTSGRSASSCSSSCELDCILLAGRYTLLEQPALEQLLPLCEQRRVSIICGGPFNSGILAAGSRAGASAHYNYAAPPPARARARAPARRAVRGFRRAAAGRGAAVPARASARRERGRRLRQRRRSAQLRGDVLASDSRRILARAARARPRRRARAAARMSQSMTASTATSISGASIAATTAG